MSTVFEKIIEGAIPGRFVWADDVCVAFSTIAPVAPGHVLVVPRHPYPSWTQTPEDVDAHLFAVARTIGRAQVRAFGVPRAGVIVAGFEVEHTHIHVIPARTERDCSLQYAVHDVAGDQLDAAAEKLRAQLRADGHATNVPARLGSPALA